MCGLPLLYLEKCGHKMTPRFFALGKPSIYISIYLSIVPYIELSIYRGWQEVTEKPPQLLIGAIFFDAVKIYCYILMRSICSCVYFFFFFFFFSRGLGCLPAPGSVTKAIAGLQIRALLKLLGCVL